MEITAEQYEKIKESLPVQRGNVRLSNLTVLNALLYVAEHGCKWRGLPKRFGNWHSIYVRMNRWAKNGVLDQVFEKLQLEQIVRIKIEAFSLDSAIVQVHPDDLGALEKTDPSHRQVPRRKDHQDSSGCRECSNGHNAGAVAGQRGRCTCGRQLLLNLGPMPEGLPMIMDKAYEGDETRQTVLDLGMMPVVPPKSNRLDPWEYSRELYKKRNEIERLHVVCLAFLYFTIIVEALRVG